MRYLTNLHTATLSTLLAASLAVSGLSIDQADAAEVSFAGKTVAIAHYGGPGSPGDIWFRQLGPYLTKHLPGGPKVSYINKPGAGSVMAANYIYNVLKPNGLQIGAIAAPGAVESVRGRVKVQFDTTKMGFIGSLTITRVIAYRGDSGIKDLDTMLNSGKPTLAAVVEGDSIYYDAFYRIMGLKFKKFTAYQGFRGRMQAFRTGEVGMMPYGHTSWVQRREGWRKADFHPIFQMGYMDGSGKIVSLKTEGLDDLMTGHELVKKYKPSAVGGRDWKAMTSIAAGQGTARQFWAPPGMPQEYLETWRTAFIKVMADPAFKAEQLKAWGLPATWIPGDQGEKIVKRFLDLNRPGAF